MGLECLGCGFYDEDFGCVIPLFGVCPLEEDWGCDS